MEKVTPESVHRHLSDQLKNLSEPSTVKQTVRTIDFIFQNLTRGSYRDHSITPEYALQIRKVIKKAIDTNSPIPIVCPYGGYKLWRLKEAPYADWAEFFYLMHKVNWLKPILTNYEPGVTFDFFSDGVFIPTLNRITKEEVDLYNNSFKDMAQRLTPYLPKNLTYTFHGIEDLYDNPQELFDEYEANYKHFTELDKHSPLEFSEQQQISAQSNVKTEAPLNDADLHELLLKHEAYSNTSKRRPYYRTPEKIFVGFTPVTGALPLRSTRTSSIRFWIGKGVLRPHEDGLIESILSPARHQTTKIIGTYEVALSDFPLKTLDRIDVVEQ